MSPARMLGEDLAGKTVLITGASGFIGDRICKRLSSRGDIEIHATSRSDRDPGTDVTKWWRSDLTDPASTTKLLRDIRPQVVIHLAGLANGARDIELTIPTLEANTLSTACLLTAATSIECERFLHCSSMEEPLEGSSDAVAISPYGLSKWMSTAYCRMFHSLYDLPTVSIRAFLVYGPGPQDVKKLVPHTISSLLDGVRPRLSSGKRRMDWIFVEDVVDAFLEASVRPACIGHTIDIGSGELVSIREVVDTITAAVNNGIKPDYNALPDRPNERSPVASMKEAHELLDWSPRTSLRDGIEATVAWYRVHRDAAKR